MLIKYKERYSVLFRIITLSVIFLFLWNDLSFALAPKLGLTQEQFQNEYLLKSFLLSHQAVNKYISRQIDPSRLIKIDVTKLEGHRSDKVVVEIGSIMDKQEIGIVAIEGLLKNTGQLAHIGLGVRNDVPVIYIDKLYFHDETVIGHEKEKIAGWEKFRRLKGFDYRQMRSWIKEHINKPDRAEKKTSRQIAEEINAASRNRKSIESLYARIKQKYKNFIAGDRRSDARALLDMANMYELYREAGYLLDENSKDINIAAHEADGAAIEPRQKIADAMLNDKYVVLLDELNRLLINAEDSPGELIDFLKLCDGVALGRPRYPIEGRYPILRAVAVMKKSDQDKLVKILESDPDYRRTIIIDSILLMLTKKIPAGWARMHAPYLTGRTVYQAAAEIWNPAGGLGRVMQFNGLNMYRICSACGIDYAQIEPFYDSGRNREGVYVPLDYAAIMGVDAENLKHIDSYDITANRQVHEAFAFEIINKDGIRMNLIGGRRKIDHFGHNYFTGGLYRYRNPSEPNLVTLDEFSGWYAAALVELQRRLEQRKYDRDPQLWKPPVAHYNDGQLGMAPYLLKTYYGDTIMSRATVAFTSHTFGNRCSFPGLWVLNGMGVPFENRKYATSQDGNTADLTSMGARTADWYGGVAAEHVDRILQKKYDTGWGEWQDNDMIAVTNGDEREITAHFYREKMRNILDGEKYPDGVDLEHPTPELALKTKAQCKSDMGLDPDLWTLSYQGRCMTEKAGRNRALTNYNIRALVKYGVQVIIGANSSSDPYIIDGLQLLADQLAREKAADPAGYKGSLTLVKNIDIEMQRKILAASDAQAQDSDPHSEAAGAQELDLAACGGIVIAPPWTEGSLQSQGVKIDLDDENSLGNIVVPEMRLSEEEIDNVLCDDEMRRAVEQSYLTAYKKLFKLGEFESDQPNKKLFRLQALSVRLSRVCEAILTAAEYLRQFSAAVAKKEGAIAAEPSAAPAHVAALSGPTGSVENIPATPESPAHTGFGIWMKQNSNSYTDEGYFSMSALGLRQDIDNGNIPGNFSKIPVDIAIADRTFHIDLAVHKSVLERLPEGMTIQQFIENCIKIRAPTQYGQILMLERLIKNLERKPFIIDAVSKSPSLYGDCIQNRYCYINLNAPSKLDITGISHEIMHESGRADEWELLKEDIIIAARSGVTFLDISKQIGNLLDMDSPLISLLRQLAPALPDDTPRPSTQAGEGVVKKIPKDKAKYLIEKLNQGTAAIHKIIDSEISAFPPKVNRANSVHYLSAKVKDAYKDLFAQIAGQIGKDIPAFGRLATEIERGNFSQQVVMEVLEETFMKSGLFILFDMGQFFIKEIDDFVEIPILNVYPVLQSEDLDTDMISRSIKMKAVAIEASRVPSYVKYRFGHDEIIAAAISKIKVDGSLPIIYIPKNLENQLRVFHAEFLNIADPARGGYLSGDVATRIPIINETFKRLITKQWAGVTITTSGDQFVRKYYNSFRDYVLRREAIRCVMQTSGELAPFLMDMAEGDNHWLRLFDFIRYLFKLPKGTSASNLAAASFILRHLVPHVSGVRIPEPELRKHLYMNTLFEAIPNMDEKALKGCARDLLQCLIQAKEAQDAARRPFEEVAKEPPANSMTRRQFIKLAAGGLLAAGAIGGGLTAITIRSKREIEKQMALERELERQEDAKIPSYPPEQKKKPLEERINALNADELAKKGIFFFGKDNYYRDLITGKQKRGSEKYGLFGFISWYTRFELTDLIEEALGEEISDEASENKAVAAALDKKAGEIRDSASAVSIEDRIRRLETKEEKLALLLSAIPNINRAHKHAGLIQGDFERLMKAHGLEWMLEEFPQLKSLFDLLLSINSVFYYSEKNFVEVRKILNEFNQKLFMPHGFYAPEDLIDNFIEGKIDDWLFKVRFRSTFQGKDICVVQRIRDNGARLNAFGIADRFKKTSRVAVVFYDETLDRAREHFQATHGQKRFIAGGFEDKELQKDFERDMTLLFIKAEEEDPRLKDFDFLLSFYIRDTIWHEIAHIIWGGEGEIVPYLSSICYSQPHLAGIVPISWMYNDDRRGVYSGIMAPITGMERESAPGIRGWRILQYRSVEKFRRMGAEEIRAKAKELLRNQAPALYKTLESEEGKRLRDDILKSTSSQGFSSPAATQQAGSRGIDSAFAAALAIFADNGGDSPIESKAQPSEKTANPAPAGDRQGLPREPSQNIIEDAFKAAMVIDSASEIAGVSLNAEGLAIVNEIHDELKGEIEKYGNRHIITSLRNTRDRVKDPAKKAIDELMDELNKPDGEFRYENPAYQAIVKLVRGWPKRHYHAHIGDSVHAKFKEAYLKSGRYDLGSWEKMITHVALQNFADGVRDLHLSIRVDREGVGTPEEVIAASIRGCKEAETIAGSYLKEKFSA
ncbi:MAG: glycogen/starch synthase, partial [Candidatus Omnitrophica bacterium]|nr:glycogen/starch synthase [Candidatus Omnitrophota bacterium]